MSEIEARVAALSNLRMPARGRGTERRSRPPRRGRPAFALVVAAAGGMRIAREVLQRLALSRYGLIGLIAVGAAGLALMLVWRADQRRRIRRRGGAEFTPEVVARQIADSAVGAPAFPEDGTLLGASILVVNQRAKLLEVNTEYEVFGTGGATVGSIRQIGQSSIKRVVRVLTVLDQYFTHHFEILSADGQVLLRLTRPRKVFRSTVHVFDATNHFLGTIRQENVFWKIRFQMLDRTGQVVGGMRAENLRAWDFHVHDAAGHQLATVVKSWEGWARTAFTRADRYVVRIHRALPSPLRELTLATALTADVALKQDARGLG